MIIGIQAATAPPVPASTPRPKTSPTSSWTDAPKTVDPNTVVRTFFKAISVHDWTEVWRIGGKNLGRGLYSSYDGMVAGYTGTIRDMPLTLVRHGDSVSGRMLAYETDGSVRTYEFGYTVHGTVIVTGSLRLLQIGHPSLQPHASPS
jgi:hypothetical protein